MSLHLSKSIECTMPRVNPKVNCGLWLLMTCHCRFISCNTYITTLVWDIDNVEGYA